ncbi:MAG: site-specific integrase [Alphaproteobacteria bacterium]|nr:site-specific integrase [Alphaproteobacteria bacterium]
MLYQRNYIYYTSYYHNGMRYRQSLHTTNEKEAKSREITIISYMRDNRIKTGEITLWRDFKDWYRRYLIWNKSKGTQYIHNRAIDLLEAYRTPYYLRHITPDFINEWKSFLIEEYGGKRAACRNRYVRAIKTMMRAAEKQGKIGVKQHWESVSKDKSEQENRIEHHTEYELVQIKSALKDEGDLLTVFYLGWSCGLRRGEMAHLYKSDYDPVNHTISITPKEDWRPKTKKSIRTLPLIPEVETVIQASIERTANSPYLINLPGKRESCGYISQRYIRTLKAKLPELHCYLHKLRHTFGSLLIKKEIPIKVVSDLMGHRNILQTEKYIHIGDKQYVKAVDSLPRI